MSVEALRATSTLPLHPNLSEFDTQFKALQVNPPSVDTMEGFEQYQDVHTRLKRLLARTNFTLLHEIEEIRSYAIQNLIVDTQAQKLETNASVHHTNLIECQSRKAALKVFHAKMKLKALPSPMQTMLFQNTLTELTYTDITASPESIGKIEVTLKDWKTAASPLQNAVTTVLLSCRSLKALSLRSPSSSLQSRFTLYKSPLIYGIMFHESLTILWLTNVQIALELQPPLFKIIEEKLTSIKFTKTKISSCYKNLFLQSIINSRKLKEVEIEIKKIFNPRSLKQIAEFITTTNKISVLKIKKVKADLDNGKQFSEALMHNNTVTQFSLTFNSIDFAVQAGTLFSRTLEKNSTLDSLKLKNKKPFHPIIYPQLLSTLQTHNNTLSQLILSSRISKNKKPWKETIADTERLLEQCLSLKKLRLPFRLSPKTRQILARNSNAQIGYHKAPHHSAEQTVPDSSSGSLTAMVDEFSQLVKRLEKVASQFRTFAEREPLFLSEPYSNPFGSLKEDEYDTSLRPQVLKGPSTSNDSSTNSSSSSSASSSL